jgi:endoglucanase
VILRMAGQGSVRILSRDADLTGVWALSNTGGTSNWGTAQRQVFLPGGLQRFRIQIETGGFNLNWIELSPISSEPISNGLHSIQNVGTGQRLNLDGNDVVMSASGRDWDFEHSGAGQYTVGANGDFWTLFMGPLHLTPWWGAERFIMLPFGDGTYRIVHSGNGRCFLPSTTNAPRLDTVACSTDANQRWTIP